MSFIVVQTRKTVKSKPELTVVPVNCVIGDTLHYPPSDLNKLFTDPNLKPDLNTWKTNKCKVVGTANTFVEAETLIDQLLNVTDSEDAIELTRATRGTPAQKIKKFTSKTYTLTPSQQQQPPVSLV